MTRRTAFTGSSAGRRRERRAALQNAVTASAETLHRPTLSRAQIQAKGSHFTPATMEEATPIKFVAQDAEWEREEYKRNLERAAILYSNELRQPADRENHRTWYSKPGEYGITCHGRQKIKGKSIPLI
ncbi:TPA: antitermination protein [Escherichia coli]|nr:antitermination protein [Escherichia coli]HCO3884099.1 antitermination protein [Escherichia coli]